MLSLLNACINVFDMHGTGITALATLVIAAFTGTLWRATSLQASLSRNAIIADKRAFVFATNIQQYWDRNAAGEYLWRFRPIWQNSGDTTTKQLRIYTECEVRNSELPLGFDFTRVRYAVGSGMAAPKGIFVGGLAPPYPGAAGAAIGPQDIFDVQQGRRYIYVWGRASYFDVFSGTPEHITRFCWLITPVGDPFNYLPAGPGQAESLTFPSIHHFEGNSADDEAAPQPRQSR